MTRQALKVKQNLLSPKSTNKILKMKEAQFQQVPKEIMVQNLLSAKLWKETWLRMKNNVPM